MHGRGVDLNLILHDAFVVDELHRGVQRQGWARDIRTNGRVLQCATSQVDTKPQFVTVPCACAWVYKLDHISGPKNCGKWNRNLYFKRREIIRRQICPTPCCIHIFSFTECYEISKDIRTENVIRHENAILAPFECYDICTNTIGCNFYLINHRVTPMRGCWLFYNDPHFKSSTQQSQIIGSSYCSKTSKVVISNNIHLTIAYLFRI